MAFQVASLVLKVEAATEQAKQKLQTMDTKWQTFSRGVEQRGRKINEWMKAHKLAAVAIIGAITGVMYKLMQFSPALSYFAAQTELWFHRIAMAIDPYLRNALEIITPYIEDFIGNIENAENPLLALLGNLALIVGILGIFGKLMGGGILLAGFGLDALIKHLEESESPIAHVLASLVKIGSSAGQITFEGLAELPGRLAEALLEAFGMGDLAKTINDWMSGWSWSTIGDKLYYLFVESWTDIPEKLGKWLTNQIITLLTGKDLSAEINVTLNGWDLVEDWVNNWLLKLITNPLQFVIDVALAGWDLVEDWVNGFLGEWLAKPLGKMIGVALDGWLGVEDWINNFLIPWITNPLGMIIKVALEGWKLVEDWFDWLGKWIGKWFNVGIKVVSDIAKAIWDFFSGAAKWFGKTFTTTFNLMVPGLGTLLEKLGQIWDLINIINLSNVPTRPGAHVTGTVPMGDFGDQAGVPFVTAEGWRYIHRGEEIRPAAISRQSPAPEPTIIEMSYSPQTTISAGGTASMRDIERMIDEKNRAQRNDIERMIRSASYDDYARRRR